MSSPVNPILVVKNNLPEFVAELKAERVKLQDRIACIDENEKIARELAFVVGVDVDPQL